MKKNRLKIWGGFFISDVFRQNDCALPKTRLGIVTPKEPLFIAVCENGTIFDFAASILKDGVIKKVIVIKNNLDKRRNRNIISNTLGKMSIQSTIKSKSTDSRFVRLGEMLRSFF